MTVLDATVLVVAKAPVAGFAKTRLTPDFSPEEAAELAAAALLDTLAAVRDSAVRHRIVAWTGDLSRAPRSDEIHSALADFQMVGQRGGPLGQRLAAAFADVAALGKPVLQIGMDTPQASSQLLEDCTRRLLAGEDAVLGPAADGGWWALGLMRPSAARVLASVPMSTPRTGELTCAALRSHGCSVTMLPTLCDVDTAADAAAVAAAHEGEFARTLARLQTEAVYDSGAVR